MIYVLYKLYDKKHKDSHKLQKLTKKEYIFHSFDTIINDYINDSIFNYNNIIHLDCNACNLLSLPQLPNSLKYLNCCYNQLTSLPKLPNSLMELNCHDNQLTLLPEIPKKFIILWGWNNKYINKFEYIKKHKYIKKIENL
jgi:hypothetical protein